MEEIPGKETVTILKKRTANLLASKVSGFKNEYPGNNNDRVKTRHAIAFYLDHTLLKQQSSAKDFEKLCNEAIELQVHSVCVPSNRVTFVAEKLAGSNVKICTVIGFPFGYATTQAKVAEAKVALEDGADELDMVIPVGLVKDGDYAGVYNDVWSIVQVAGQAIVKAILETSELSLEEKIMAGSAACFAGARFLKTSTGFASGGAQIDDIHILRQVAGDRIGVKASGGVKDRDFALALIQAGADRIGTSNSALLINGKGSTGGGY